MKKIYYLIFILFVMLAVVSSVTAHSGRTDSSGCHTCKTNCASWGLSSGEYHCHRAKSYAPQPLEPVTSHKNEGGVGYTEPAPEYKIPATKTVIPLTTKEIEKAVPKVLGISNETQKVNTTNQTEDNFGSGFFWGLFTVLAGIWGYKKIKK